jgi:hypothetical protein
LDLSRVELVIYSDDDDFSSGYFESSKILITHIVGIRMSMGSYNTTCLQKSRGEIIVLVNDDMVVRSAGWDQMLFEMHARFDDQIYLAYGNDLFKKGNLCTFPILSRRTCELLIDPYPSEYRGAFIDYHLFDIFKRLKAAGLDRIFYLEELVFEHLHFRVGKAPFDETYAARDRFEGDMTFLSLIGRRVVCSERLVKVLTLGDAPIPYLPETFIKKDMPTSVFSALTEYASYLLFDKGLPLKWRTYLWIWFFGRYLASRGFLRTFGSK